jgi:hypothetical protein
MVPAGKAVRLLVDPVARVARRLAVRTDLVDLVDLVVRLQEVRAARADLAVVVVLPRSP